VKGLRERDERVEDKQHRGLRARYGDYEHSPVHAYLRDVWLDPVPLGHVRPRGVVRERRPACRRADALRGRVVGGRGRRRDGPLALT
jgi:hypothetical protein